MNKLFAELPGFIDFKDAGNGLVLVQIKDSAKQKKFWAVFDQSGTQLTPFVYNHIEVYKQNYAIATILHDNVDNKTFVTPSNPLGADLPADASIMYTYTNDKVAMCLIDQSGKVFRNTYFSRITFESDNVYHLSSYNSSRGYLTDDGIYMSPQFSELSLLSNGYFRILQGLDKDMKYTYAMIDKQGKCVIPPKTYIALGLINEHGATLYMKNNPTESGYIDTQGNTFTRKHVGDTYIYVDANGQPAPLSKPKFMRKGIDNSINFLGNNQKYGYIDDEGDVFIQPAYDDCSSTFWGGLAYVKKGDKWGFIDKSNREITPVIYESAGFIAPGYGQAILDGVMYLIGMNGVIASQKGGYFGHKVKRADSKTNVKRYSCGVDFIWYVLFDRWHIQDTIDYKGIQPYDDTFTYMLYDEDSKQYYFETGKNKGVTIDGKPIKVMEKEDAPETDEKSEIGEKALFNLQELYENREVPALWSELLLKPWAWNDRFSWGVELMDDPNLPLDAMFGTTDEQDLKQLGQMFYYLANADGTGGQYAYFVTDPGMSLDEAPIVFFGSEGEINLVASDLSQFLQLISIDTEPMGTCEMTKSEIISFYKDINDEPSRYYEKYLKWLKSKDIKPIVVKQESDDQPKAAQKIIKDANKLYFKQLQAIHKKYFG